MRIGPDGVSHYLSSVYRNGEFEDEGSVRRYRIGKPSGGTVLVEDIGVPTRKAKGWESWQ